MKRGIRFEIPNEYGSYLCDVLTPLDITKFNWQSGGVESYFIENNDELGELLFTDVDGSTFKKIIEDNKHYLIFVDLKAYSKGKNLTAIETYKDFKDSDCELVLLIVDSIYVTIYCKDSEKLERLYSNAKIRKFTNLQYITDNNDELQNLTI